MLVVLGVIRMHALRLASAALCAVLVASGCTGAGTPAGQVQVPKQAPAATASSSPSATSAPPCTIPAQFKGLDLARLPVAKKLVAELSLDKEMLQDVVRRKL